MVSSLVDLLFRRSDLTVIKFESHNFIKRYDSCQLLDTVFCVRASDGDQTSAVALNLIPSQGRTATRTMWVKSECSPTAGAVSNACARTANKVVHHVDTVLDSVDRRKNVLLLFRFFFCRKFH